jgi:hypothetical protein
MLLLVVGVSVLLIIIGLYGVASPSGLIVFANRWGSKAGLWTASLIRIVFGLALWSAAPSSRAPFALYILAVLAMLSGIALLLMGHARYQSFLSWWSRRSPLFVRMWCLAAVIFGAFVLWSVAA